MAYASYYYLYIVVVATHNVHIQQLAWRPPFKILNVYFHISLVKTTETRRRLNTWELEFMNSFRFYLYVPEDVLILRFSNLSPSCCIGIKIAKTFFLFYLFQFATNSSQRNINISDVNSNNKKIIRFDISIRK